MSSPKRSKYSTKDDGTNESEYLKSLQAIEILQEEMNNMKEKSDQEVLKLEKMVEMDKKSIYDESEYLKLLQTIETLQAEVNIMKKKFTQAVLKLDYKLEIDMKPIFDKREETLSLIPNFWADALMNHPKIATLLDESEEEYISYLSKIDVQVVGEETAFSFKIIFHFKENPFFKNTSLVKEYVQDYQNGEDFKNVTPSIIIWKDGQDISQKLKDRKSFLFWLTSQEFGKADNDIAEVIKEDLWMNPHKYYPYFVLSNNEQEGSNNEDREDNVPIFEDSDEE